MASITVTFNVGSLPPGFCPTSYQNLLQAFVNAMTGTINGFNYSEIQATATEPAISNNYAWLQLSGGGLPLQLYWASGGNWVPVQPTFFFPGLTDIGIVNALQVSGVVIPVTLGPPPGGVPVTGLVKGMTFLVKASVTNTGASTFQVNSYSAAAIQVGTTAVVANQILANNWYLIQYDGTVFQLLNANPQATAAFGKLVTSPLYSFTKATPASVSFAHGLGAVPTFVRLVGVAQNNVGTIPAGNTVDNNAFVIEVGSGTTGFGPIFTISSNATNVTIQPGLADTGGAAGWSVWNDGNGSRGGGAYVFNNADWKFQLYVSL